MLIRIISGLLGLPILAVFLIFGGHWLLAAVGVVAAIGFLEFYRAFGLVRKLHYVLIILSVSIHMILIGFFGAVAAFVVPMVLPMCLMAINVLRHKDRDIYAPAIGSFGFVYIVLTLSMVYLLRDGFGAYAVWLIFIAAWGCDTGAYFTGMAIGRRKLAPVLSPKKTVEGAVGGSVVATLLGAVYGLILYNAGVVAPNAVVLYALTTLVCSVAAQFGDLAASAIKRQRCIKDFGNVMPGHGGVLDRFDSIIFAAPVAFLILVLAQPLMRGGL